MTYVGGPAPEGCIFCDAAQTATPRDRLVLCQGAAVVMLNRFPYASGHLLVAPASHVGDLGALPADDFVALMRTLQRVTAVVQEVFRPDGMNVGINLGQVAGAGIADHVHWHIVPRWSGDTNFMPMLADVRVMPEHLEATYERLAPHFAGPPGSRV